MKRYEFHSTLPPEELKKELDRWVRVENILLDKSGKVKVKWWGMRLRLSRWDFETSDHSGTSVTPFSVSTSAGMSYSALNESPFWGEVVPNDVGGSVLRGFFFPPLWGILLVTPIIVGSIIYVVRELLCSFSLYSVLFFSILTYILVNAVIKERRTPPRPKRNLKFLEKYFQELEA